MLRIGGRRFVKCDTGVASRGDFFNGGVVVMPNLLQVYGPASVRVSVDEDALAEAQRMQREYMAARARRQRLPSALRYERHNDPRFWTDIEDYV